MDLKQKRKEYLKREPLAKRVMVALGMYKVWMEPRGTTKLPPLKCEKVNPYHPLVWVLFLGIWVAFSLKSVFWDFWKDISDEFGIRKYS